MKTLTPRVQSQRKLSTTQCRRGDKCERHWVVYWDTVQGTAQAFVCAATPGKAKSIIYDDQKVIGRRYTEYRARLLKPRKKENTE